MNKRVIAMGYGNVPLDRIVVHESDGHLYVVNPDRDLRSVERERGGVGFPREFVFEEDPRLLAALTEAYNSGDSERLESLWRTARPLKDRPLQ
jgi:hypothetical protein